MELRDALSQISEIRTRMERAQVFRGYRSVTTAFSGLVAVGAGILQPVVVSEPATHLTRFLSHWIGAAGLSLIVVAAEMIFRGRRRGQGTLTLRAVEHFVPALIAGGLLTYVIAAHAPDAAWMLPGLWMIVFALGVFASCRVLPRGAFFVAGMYLLAGLAAIVLSRKGWAFSPWLMAIPFGAGQVAMAGLLYWSLERKGAADGR
jgi:hypothetical protein